jgi:Cd2+/Zn2+-exporting ATPase
VKKHKLDLDLALPSDAVACDACVERMVAALGATRGITRVHVDREDPARPKLCLHYDPSSVRLEEVEALVESTGAALNARYEHLSAPAVGLRHERQARLVEGVFARQPGVLHASVAFGSRRLYVEFDPAKTSRGALLAIASKAGIVSYAESASPAAAAAEHEEHEHEHGGPFGERSELVFSLACGALTGIGWGLEKAGVASLVTTSLFVVAYVLGAWFTVKEVVVALRARKFEIDFLMLLAAIGAAILGEWFEGALLLFLFTLGHGLEGYAMRRARNAIGALAKLVPETALRINDDGREEDVAVTELVVGDRILVKPNTRIPADGFVSAGSSSVNQAPITGESVPVDKRPVSDLDSALAAPEGLEAEHRVFAGTINGAAAITALVTKTASESTLARVVKLVAEAETQKSPTQQFTDRFERAFVPVILVVVVGLLFAWVLIDEPFTRSFYRAMAVLVAASPCALAIATPSAVLSGVARAARAGVLVKGGAHLESLGLVRAIAFDKTGTLTEGKPRLTDVITLDGADEDELLAVAVAVERQSDHPLASAIVEGVGARRPGLATLEASAVEAVVGYGVRATVGGAEVAIGKPGLFTRDGALPQSVSDVVGNLQSEGRSHGRPFGRPLPRRSRRDGHTARQRRGGRLGASRPGDRADDHVDRRQSAGR